MLPQEAPVELLIVAVVIVLVFAVGIALNALALKMSASWVASEHIEWGPAFGVAVCGVLIGAGANFVVGSCLGSLFSILAVGALIMAFTGIDLAKSMMISFGMTVISVVLGVLLLLVGGSWLVYLGA